MAVPSHSTGVSEKFIASAIFRLKFMCLKDSDIPFIPNVDESACLPSCTMSRTKISSCILLFFLLFRIVFLTGSVFRPSTVVSIRTTYLNMNNLPVHQNDVCFLCDC
jgi:hypothetical protein